MINKIMFTLVFLILMSWVTYAQEDSTSLRLKDGSEMSVVVMKVDQWGLTTSDDRMALFRVMSELRTRDTSLVRQVLAVVDSIEVRRNGDLTILDFQHARYQKPPPASESMISLKSLSFSGVFDYALNGTFQLDLSFRDFHPLVVSPAFAFGQTFNTGKSTVGGSLGAGYLRETENSRLMVLLNYGAKYIESDSTMSTEFYPLFVSADLHLFAGESQQYIIDLGVYANINKVTYNGHRQLFGIRIGFGLNLSKFSFFGRIPGQ